MAQRFDRGGALMPPERTDEGFLFADASVSCPGVFTYVEADGTIVRELRPRAEVFHPDSLASFARKPTCLGHPVGPDGKDIKITPSNARAFATGAASERVWVDEDADVVRSTLTIFDADHIAAIAGGVVEQSCGYDCKLVYESGVDPEFGPYDRIQTRIRGNHIATVEKGRAGQHVRLRADAAMQLPTTHEDAPMSAAKKPAPTKRADGEPVTDQETKQDSEERVMALDAKVTALTEKMDTILGMMEAAMQQPAEEVTGDEDEPVGDEDEPVGDEGDEPVGDEEGNPSYVEVPKADRADAAELARFNERAKLLGLISASKPIPNADKLTNKRLAREIAKAELGSSLRADASDAYISGVIETIAARRKPAKRGGEGTRSAAETIAAERSKQRTDAAADDGRSNFAQRLREGVKKG